jgi:hypothetical protein
MATYSIDYCGNYWTPQDKNEQHIQYMGIGSPYLKLLNLEAELRIVENENKELKKKLKAIRKVSGSKWKLT